MFIFLSKSLYLEKEGDKFNQKHLIKMLNIKFNLGFFFFFLEVNYMLKIL